MGKVKSAILFPLLSAVMISAAVLIFAPYRVPAVFTGEPYTLREVREAIEYRGSEGRTYISLKAERSHDYIDFDLGTAEQLFKAKLEEKGYRSGLYIYTQGDGIWYGDQYVIIECLNSEDPLGVYAAVREILSERKELRFTNEGGVKTYFTSEHIYSAYVERYIPLLETEQVVITDEDVSECVVSITVQPDKYEYVESIINSEDLFGREIYLYFGNRLFSAATLDHRLNTISLGIYDTYEQAEEVAAAINEDRLLSLFEAEYFDLGKKAMSDGELDAYLWENARDFAGMLLRAVCYAVALLGTAAGITVFAAVKR